MPECQAKIRRFTLSAEEYTPIVAPAACSYFAILGNEDGSALFRSSTGCADGCWYRMAPGVGYGLIVAHIGASLKRFGEGEIVTWLKTESGSGPAIVEFI